MRKVFIGVGHGGSDPGAVANGLEEKDVNLIMALAMREELGRCGVEVGISRTADMDDTTAQEIAKCAAFGADIAVEVHNNAGGGKGFEVYRQTNRFAEESILLAQAIESQVAAIGQGSRGVKTRLNSAGADYFGWLRQLDCPAVLCEGAFLDNAADVQMINTQAKQRAFGAAYARGVLAYLGMEAQGENGWGARGYTPICGEAQVGAEQMRAFLLGRNPQAPDYTAIYLEEGQAEGIRGDVAFAQSCLETGYWRFGGDVQPEQNNFCGLGAAGGGQAGCRFDTPREGIRAQVQHLKAYAGEEALVQDCVDPRFGYVQRGCAPYVEWLGIPDNPQGRGWATAQGYGKSIVSLLEEMRGAAGEPLEALRGENAALREQLEEMRRAIAALAERFAG